MVVASEPRTYTQPRAPVTVSRILPPRYGQSSSCSYTTQHHPSTYHYLILALSLVLRLPRQQWHPNPSISLHSDLDQSDYRTRPRFPRPATSSLILGRVASTSDIIFRLIASYRPRLSYFYSIPSLLDSPCPRTTYTATSGPPPPPHSFHHPLPLHPLPRRNLTGPSHLLPAHSQSVQFYHRLAYLVGQRCI